MAPFQPEEDAAKMRQRSGISRVVEVPRDIQFLAHPSVGGSRGYNIHTREMMVELHKSGNPVPQTMICSIQRWVQRIVPHRMTGNKPNVGLTGKYLFLLVLFKLVWPHSTYYECIAFIANEANVVKIFNKKNISRALHGLGYTSKVTSTVTYQASMQRNLLHWRLFWNEPWPIGIHGTPRRSLINIDEFGLHLNAANKKYGSSPHGLKICKPGNYDRGTFKLTIILAVEAGDPAVANGLVGSLTMPRVWARISDEVGMTTEAYVNFICHVMDTYDAVADPILRQTIIYDNLILHKLPEVYEVVILRSHRVVCHPLYQPQDGPVEFGINQVCSRLEKRWSEVSDLQAMRAVIEHIIDNDISSMEETFVYCGYIWN